MKVAIILSALFAAVLAAPAAEAQPEAQPALELEKRCLANGGTFSTSSLNMKV